MLVGVFGNGVQKEEGCRWVLSMLVIVKAVGRAASPLWKTEIETFAPAVEQ